MCRGVSDLDLPSWALMVHTGRLRADDGTDLSGILGIFLMESPSPWSSHPSPIDKETGNNSAQTFLPLSMIHLTVLAKVDVIMYTGLPS